MASELSLSNKLTQKSVRERVQAFLAGERVSPWVIEMDPSGGLTVHDGS